MPGSVLPLPRLLFCISPARHSATLSGPGPTLPRAYQAQLCLAVSCSAITRPYFTRQALTWPASTCTYSWLQYQSGSLFNQQRFSQKKNLSANARFTKRNWEFFLVDNTNLHLTIAQTGPKFCTGTVKLRPLSVPQFNQTTVQSRSQWNPNYLQIIVRNKFQYMSQLSRAYSWVQTTYQSRKKSIGSIQATL